MKLFAKQKQVIGSLKTLGYKVDFNVNQLQPKTAYPFGYDGSFENLTFGMQRIRCKNAVIIVDKYDDVDSVPDLLDTTAEAVVNALKQIYEIVTLTKFDYTVFPTGKMYALYLEFEVEWTDK